MNCPACHEGDTQVIDSRQVVGGIRRRRKCKSCDHRFTTMERLSREDRTAVKQHHRRRSGGVVR